MSIKKKKKNDQTHQPLSNVLFVLLWALSYGLAWFLIHAALILLEDYAPNATRELGDMVLYSIYTVLFTVAGGVAGYMQQRLMNRQSGKRFRHWWLMTGVASGLAFLFLIFIGLRDVLNLAPLLDGLYDRLPHTGQMVFVFAYFFMPFASLQAFFLRKYVRHAWLWIGVALVGTLVFSLFFPPTTGYTFISFPGRLQAIMMVTLGMTAHGAVMGLAMVWLLQHR
jgi:glycopeptide antibiotics resistance protein